MDAGRVEIYGFRSADLNGVRVALEGGLGLLFELYESESIGPYFFSEAPEMGAELTLRLNEDPAADPEDDDEAYAEPDFPDFGVLLYVEREGGEPLTDLPFDGELLDVEMA